MNDLHKKVLYLYADIKENIYFCTLKYMEQIV
mgnify:FL=1|jgi:hypothetical protein